MSLPVVPSPGLPHADPPSRTQALVFAAKTWLLQLRRGLVNWREGLRALPCIDAQGFDHLAAQARTPLWDDSGESDASLQAGKVHNLRIAARQLNGTVLPAGALFSFWRQLGPATRTRGYVPGRMLREGCMVPAVGGGLCQLSNALYELALQGNFEIVERWPHSRIVPGSAAALGRDATVAWNYIDLRFRASHELRLSVELSSTELIVSLRSRTPWLAPRRKPSLPTVASKAPAPLPNSCDSCDATDCFRHAAVKPRAPRAQAFLVAENWPEFRAYVQAQRSGHDLLALPLDGQRWRAPRYAWPTEGFGRLQTASRATLMHALSTRRTASTAPAQLQLQMRTARAWARQFARALRPEMSEITVAQSLLPWLWLDGHLGGRRLQVLMTRLPLFELHARLDAASALHPDRRTLSEFRAPEFLVKAEQAALAQAEIVTPHQGIAALFGKRAHLLDWALPKPGPLPPKPRTGRIAFVGPTVARKGAYAVRDAARELGLTVVPLGRHLESADFWQGIATEPAGNDWLQRVDAVVQPALVEEQPRPLLQALAAGLPVIASAACGLGPHAGLRLVLPDDAKALTDCLR